MEKSNEYLRGVIGIVSMTRSINHEIGSYQEHYLNESFGFTVKLSNGAISMSREIVQDYEAQPSSITQERIVKVASTFRRI